MKEKNIDSDYAEVKNLKFVFFEFFKLINQYRTIGKVNSIILITISFLQIYYLLNQILIVQNLPKVYLNATVNYTIKDLLDPTGENKTYLPLFFNPMIPMTNDTAGNQTSQSPTDQAQNSTNGTSSRLLQSANLSQDPYHNIDPNSNYGKAIQLSIFDVLDVATKFSLLLPILEYELNIFENFYTILVIIVYTFSFALIFSCVYVIVSIVRGKEVYFKIFLSFISASFLYLQWILYIPILYIILYVYFGRLKLLLSENFLEIVILILNIFITIFFALVNLTISILNNDSINKYDNALCRKDTDLEKHLYLLKTILFFTFLIQYTEAVSTLICIFSSLMVLYLIYNQSKVKYFYDEFIARFFSSFLLCFIQKLIGGLITVFSGIYITDYSITIVICFFINFFIFDFVYKRMRILILKKNISDLKDIEEVVLYVDVIEEETNRAQIGDLVSCSIMAGYLLDHKNSCNNDTCPLLSKELFHPLTDNNQEIASNKIQDLFRNEVVLIHLLKEIYITLSDKFSGKGKFHFSYASFLLFRFGNIKLALIEIENSIKYTTSIQQEYSFYILKHNSNERLLNNQSYISNEYSKINLSILDILDVIVFDQISQDLQNGMFECSKLKVEFWSSLKQSRVLIEELYKKGKEYISKKSAVMKLWKRLQNITTSNKKIYDLYKKYLEFICDDTSNMIQENKQKLTGDIDINDIVYTRFYDDTGFVIINLDLGNTIGNINYYNKAINKMLGYQNEDLFGKNISTIMPEPIGKVHDEILANFIHTGQHSLIGKNNILFAKDKERFIKQITLLVMPMPSYNSKSEVLGLLREQSTSSYFIIINEYGIVDSFSQQITKNYDEYIDPHILECIEIEFFIFFTFPELLQPNTDKRPRLFFSDRNESSFSINAYFDPGLIPILAEIEQLNAKKDSNMKIRLKKKKKDRLEKTLKKLKSNFPDETNEKINVYTNFKKVCHQIKDAMRDFYKNSNFDLEYTSGYKHYLHFLEKLIIEKEKHGTQNASRVEEKGLIKKNFNLKISPMKFFLKEGEKEHKLYILEFTIPPADIDDEEIKSNMKKDTEERAEEANENYDKENSMQIDDAGSVSSVNINNVTSIQNIVNKIREESDGVNSHNKSSHMNSLLLLLLLIILGFIIYYNLYIYFYSVQQDYIVKGVLYYYNTRQLVFDARKYTYTMLLDREFSLPNMEVYDLEDKMIETSLGLILLQKEITSILLEMRNKEDISQIENLKYNLNGKEVFFNDILHTIILDTILLSGPRKIPENDKISELLASLKIDDDLNIAPNDQDRKHSAFLLYNTNNLIELSIEEIIQVLRSIFDLENTHILNLLYYGYIILLAIAILIIVIIFLILKKRYNINKNILELLNLITNAEIDELITKVEQFKLEIKVVNSNIESKINHLETKSEIEDLDQYNADSGFLESQSGLMDKKYKEKNIFRKENIMVSFVINIAIILFWIGLYLGLIYFFSAGFIGNYNLLFNYFISIFKSSSNNQKILSNVRDVFVSNDTALYDQEALISSYLPENFNISKASNDRMFKEYSENKTLFPKSLNGKLDEIFFNNLCTTELISIDCIDNEIDFTRVFNKGFKYAVDYYSNYIENLISTYNTYKDQSNLFTIFLERNDQFIFPIILESYQLRSVYDYLITNLEIEIYQNSDLFCVIIIVVSTIFIVLEFFSIMVKWQKYIDKIKLEEYMSNKIIAEIPMSIIKSNKLISKHLHDFSTKNS